MEFDYSKLRGRIVEKFGTQGNFAKAMNWSERTMALHMNNKVEWKQRDMIKALSLLELVSDDVQPYFFTLKVQ